MRRETSLAVVMVGLLAVILVAAWTASGTDVASPTHDAAAPEPQAGGLVLRGSRTPAALPNGLPPPPPDESPAPQASRAVHLAASDAAVGPAQVWGLLTLQLTDPRGKPVDVATWFGRSRDWHLEPGWTVRHAAVAGTEQRVALRHETGIDGALRLPIVKLVVRVPDELPADVAGTVPDWDRDVSDPLVVLPVDAASGRGILAARWEPPLDGGDLPTVVADERGFLHVPKPMLEAASRRGVPPLAALLAGINVPRRVGRVDPDYALPLEALDGLARGGVLRLPVAISHEVRALRSVRIVGSEGLRMAGLRAVFSGQRERTDASGELRLDVPAEGGDLEVYGPDGALWEVHALPKAGSDDADPSSQVQLRARRRVEIELETRVGAEPADLRFELCVEMEGTPVPTGRGFTRSLADRERSLVVDLSIGMPYQLRLLPRETTARAVDAVALRSGVFFVVEPDDVRLTFDWPPTRVVSRSSR